MAAQAEGADYIGFGPLYATGTKPDYVPIGLADIAEAHRRVSLPIFCIGGVNATRLDEVLAGQQRPLGVGEVVTDGGGRPNLVLELAPGVVTGFLDHPRSDLGDGKRWVVVRAANGPALLLARASDERQAARVGDQTGGRVAFFLETDNFAADHARMLAAGVRFTEPPRSEPYGTVAVFADLHGNLWDLIEPR